MAGLISSADAVGIRAALAVFLVHTCVLTPRVASTPDGENDVTYTAGTPVTGVACKYIAEDRVRLDDAGRTLVSVPTLTVAAGQTIAPGATVSNVQDSEGTVLLAGPATVEYVVASAGLGPTLKLVAVLRAGDVR